MIKDSRSYETQIIDAVRSVNRALGGTYGRSSAIYKSEFNQYEVQLIDAIRSIGRTLSGSGLSLAAGANGSSEFDTSILDNYVTITGTQTITGLKTFRNANGIRISDGSVTAGLYIDSDGALHSTLPFVSDSWIAGYNARGGSSGGGGGISSVKVNGTALTISDGAVNILIASGSADGTIKVNNVDIAVTGLRSAAYSNASAFDAAGAAASAASGLIGSSNDQWATSKTLYALSNRIDAIVTTGGEPNVIESVTLNGTALKITNKAATLTIAESTTDGCISVGVDSSGNVISDVRVHGLGTAAFMSSTSFLSANINYAGSTTPGGTALAAYKLREIVSNTEQDTAEGSSTIPVYFSNGVPVACDMSNYVTITGIQTITGLKTFKNADGIQIANAAGTATAKLYIDSDGALHVTVPVVSEGYVSAYNASGNIDSALAARITALEGRVSALENNS